MVVSTAPIVLGATPPKDEEYRHEKIAFLGQVPVSVLGKVESGDYILPSGDNDGFGIAINPVDLTLNMVDQIVGVAWEPGLDEFVNIVNVAVGLNHTGNAVKLAQLTKNLEVLQGNFEELVALSRQDNASVISESLIIEKPNRTGRWISRLFKPEVSNSRTAPARKDAREAAVDGRTDIVNPAIERPEEDVFNFIDTMTDEEILTAYEETLAEKFQLHGEMARQEESLNRIVQVVVQNEIEKGRLQAIRTSEKLQAEAQRNLLHDVIPEMQRGAGSLEDLKRKTESLLAQYGHDIEQIKQPIHQVTGQILAYEFSLNRIKEVVRSQTRFSNANGQFFAVGTIAEQKLVEQIQSEMFGVVQAHFPEIAQHMGKPAARKETPLAEGSEEKKPAKRTAGGKQTQDRTTNGNSSANN